MTTWHSVHVHRCKYELQNKVSNNYVAELWTRWNLARLPGIGFLYFELVQGIPPILPHLVEKVPFIHSVLVIISIKYLPISKIETNERFLFRYVEPREYRVFRCVVRYGYNDKVEDPREFEGLLIGNLKKFILQESFYSQSSHSLGGEDHLVKQSGDVLDTSIEVQDARLSKSFSNGITAGPPNRCMDEIHLIQREMEDGVVHMLGETNVVAEPNADFLKKIKLTTPTISRGRTSGNQRRSHVSLITDCCGWEWHTRSRMMLNRLIKLTTDSVFSVSSAEMHVQRMVEGT